MTIEQANAYFASLPEGFAPARQLQEALSAKAATDQGELALGRNILVGFMT